MVGAWFAGRPRACFRWRFFWLAGCNRTHGADVVATVNGHAIVRADMDRMYAAQLGQDEGQQPSPEQADRCG